ncbi:MAG: hypothetical protein ABI628_02395, partial [Chloroflexota bacterium]
EAFAAADANRTAYPGAGVAESVATGDGWRRLIDLTEPVDQPDPAAIDTAMRAYVLGTGGEAELTDRDAAREAYRALLASGSGWLPPWYVREPMGDWSFRTATTRMSESTALLRLRDQVTAAASALDLVPNDALKAAYEGAKDGLGDATAIANRELAALAAIAEARAKLDATPDLVAQIGLVGETPRASYEGARRAFQTGQLDQALGLAGAASSILDGAAAVGQQRLVVAIVSTVGVLLLLGLLVFLVRRSARRRRMSALATDAARTVIDPAPFDPAPLEPYATLAADPATEHDEGGHARGDSPVDP